MNLKNIKVLRLLFIAVSCFLLLIVTIEVFELIKQSSKRNYIYSEIKRIEKENYFNETVYKNGLDMLIYQAFESIKIWFRKDMLKDVDFSDLKSYLERVNNAI